MTQTNTSEILDACEIPGYLVLRVQYHGDRYPEYQDGVILVFMGETYRTALLWHFVNPGFHPIPWIPKTSPTPIATFPPTDEGWMDAKNYAADKSGSE